MQATGTFLMIWVLSLLGLGVFTTDNVLAGAPAPANSAFERIKSLSGTWETKAPDGKGSVETIRVMSAGASVMVTRDATGGNMVTVFHPNGDSVMATHYCSAKNQPGFVLKSFNDPKVLAFEFKGVTNLANPDARHIRGVVIAIKDADHHTEQWTWGENGKETVEEMEFIRRK